MTDARGVAHWFRTNWLFLTALAGLVGAAYRYHERQNEKQDARIAAAEATVATVRDQNVSVTRLLDYVILGFCDPAQQTSLELRSLLECQRRSLRYGLPVEQTPTRRRLP